MAAESRKRSIVGKWMYVISDQERVERYATLMEQLYFFDTITNFPADFLEMKEAYAKTDAASRGTIAAEVIALLAIEDIEVFKAKVKAQLIAARREQDSLEQSRSLIYNFKNNNVIEVYTTDDTARKDTSKGFTEDRSANRLWLLANPNSALEATSKDTLGLDILYLSADSLSIKFDPVNDTNAVEPVNNKVMNFKAYRGR